MCYTGLMAQTVCVIVSAVDRERLEAIVANRNQRQKYAERARIVLASADRGPAQRVAQSLGVSRPTVWRWQALRRSRRGGSVARQDPQARQSADRGR